MTSKFRIALGLFLVSAVVGSVWLALRQRGPVYQGRPVMVWLQEGYGVNGASEESLQKANEAVHAAGVRAVPFYLGLLEIDEWTPLKTKLLHQTWIHFDFGKVLGIRRCGYAACALTILGPEAKPAIPRLTKLLNAGNEDQRARSAIVLAEIGLHGIAPLTNVLASSKSKGRSSAAFGLGRYAYAFRWVKPGNRSPEEIESAAKIIVPILLAYLRDPDGDVRTRAAEALGNFARQPDVVIPALVERLGDSNFVTRGIAAMSLGKFHVQAEFVVPGLIKSLHDPHIFVRLNAISALEGFGTNAWQAAPALVAISESLAVEKPDPRPDAARVLKIINGADPASVPLKK